MQSNTIPTTKSAIYNPHFINENPFYEEMELAIKKRDRNALLEMAKERCLNLRIKHCSLIEYLAYLGRHDDVEFFISVGGDINYALFGYALRGDFDKVENLLAQGADIRAALSGFAKAGLFLRVNTILKSSDVREDYFYNAVYAFAWGGHKEAVKEYTDKGLQILAAIRGFALGGYEEEIETFRSHPLYNINDVIYELARGGHHQLVLIYIKRAKDKFSAYLNAISGYARGCYTKELTEMIETCLKQAENETKRNENRQKLINRAVKYYAEEGHVTQVNDLIERGASLEEALSGYAGGGFTKNGHNRQAENLIKQGADPSRALAAHCVRDHVDKVYEMIKDEIEDHENLEKHFTNLALQCFAMKKNHSEVYRLIKLGADINLAAKYFSKNKSATQIVYLLDAKADIAVVNKGLEESNCFSNKNDTMKIMCELGSEEITKRDYQGIMTKHIQTINEKFNTKNLQSEINKIIKLMDKFKVTFEVANEVLRLLRNEQLTCWLTEGAQIVRNNTLSLKPNPFNKHTFFYVASFVAENKYIGLEKFREYLFDIYFECLISKNFLHAKNLNSQLAIKEYKISLEDSFNNMKKFS